MEKSWKLSPFVAKPAEDFIRVDGPKKKARAVAVRSKPGSEVYIQFPTKRPPLEVIKSFHPGILDVRLPRQNTARFCFLVFSNKEKAQEARKVINKMKYEGSKGRGLRAEMRKTNKSDVGDDSHDERGTSTAIAGDTVGLDHPIKEEDVESSEETPPVEQKIEPEPNWDSPSENGTFHTPKRYWNTEPGSLVRIKPEMKTHSSEKSGRLKKLRKLTSKTPQSEPGNILRIKSKTKLGKLKKNRKSL
ncbi:uncharacterized protein [Anabrus simplex]|uniref:uncharacterized protein n=1 Tax=Anabrus simplex TaxID=316456 RepID=UPI0035A28A84